MSDPKQHSAPPRIFRFLVPVGAALSVAGAGAFWWASQNSQPAPGQEAAHQVAVNARDCTPMDLTVAAGRRSFEITNNSDRPVEWEILDGVMVLAERENILPGYKSVLNVNLAPGDYEITCGLLTNPRGVLHVTPSEEWSAATANIGMRDFLGGLGEYKVYLIMQGKDALTGAEALQGAIAAGDLPAAQAAWAAARGAYKRIEPMAYKLSDLENSINPVAAFLADHEEDPGFTGYHRLEYGLFAQGALDGLSPFAEKLVEDLTALRARLSAAEIKPAQFIALPGDMARILADGRIAAGEDQYAHTDLDGLSANLDGIAKLTGLLATIAAPGDPELEKDLNAQLAATRAALEAFRSDGVFPAYDTVNAEARKALSASFNDLAAALDRLNPAIGGI